MDYVISQFFNSFSPGMHPIVYLFFFSFFFKQSLLIHIRRICNKMFQEKSTEIHHCHCVNLTCLFSEFMPSFHPGIVILVCSLWRQDKIPSISQIVGIIYCHCNAVRFKPFWTPMPQNSYSEFKGVGLHMRLSYH